MKIYMKDRETGEFKELKGLTITELPTELLSALDQERVKTVENNLNKAIQQENYELASICRDELKKLKAPK
jgi:protein-arginine kinase activator protein McsA